MAGQSVFQAVAKSAEAFPDHPAFTGMGHAQAYSELIADAECLASALHGAGCGPGKTIAVVSRNNPYMALVWLASARLGSTVSLVNFMFHTAELATLLSNLRPAILFAGVGEFVTCQAAIERVGLDIPCVLLESEPQSDFHSTIGQMLESPRYTGPHPGGTDPHEISYTSGTTSGAADP